MHEVLDWGFGVGGIEVLWQGVFEEVYFILAVMRKE